MERGPRPREQYDRPEYSKAFNELLAQYGVEQLMKGSHVEGVSFETWEEKRRPIAQHIISGGTLLDFGCANGFLLKCLEEWSNKEFDVYGIDTDVSLIEQARELYPSMPDHFAVTPQEAAAFTEQFQTIYWNIWDNIEAKEAIGYLRQLLDRLAESGQLLIGSYDENLGRADERFAELIRSLEGPGLQVVLHDRMEGKVEQFLDIQKTPLT